MLKAEFIDKVQKILPGASKKDINTLLDAIIETIGAALSRGEEVKIVNFGTFKMRKIAAHDGVDPIAKKKIHIPETSVPYFKVSKKFKESVADWVHFRQQNGQP